MATGMVVSGILLHLLVANCVYLSCHVLSKDIVSCN